ncbi:hypothetical protein AB8615_00165 [Litorimonas sp. RW-G-Af-16]|uniref:hypothetical protein n=1 Tax=Litorimonas sp. RW-G-Af-16 TaxID=3241168 RepID=UPI003AAB64D6
MPNKTLLVGAVSLVATLAASAPAFAGHCASGQNCQTDVRVINDYAPKFGPMTVRNTPPMGHFRSIDFQRAPNVSITRVHGMAPTAGLSDAPSGFTDGCHPTSTTYCRQDAGIPVTVDMAPRPVVQQPVYQAPVMRAPVVAAPAPRLHTWVGKGYDPSKFAPRQYGENILTPGIAHIPTSIVDRDPARAQAVLNSGRTVPQARANGGTVPHMGMVQQSMPAMGSVTLPGTFASAPQTMPAMGSVTLPGTFASAPSQAYGSAGTYNPAPQAMSYSSNAPRTILRETPYAAPAQAPVHAGNNTYVSNIGADGTYWEKTSGLTTFGSTVATQVICKRKVKQQVVNPVVGVPVPVPTRVVNPIINVPVPVPTPVEVPYCEAPAPVHAMHGQHGRPAVGHHGGGRYGQQMPGRWVQ